MKHSISPELIHALTPMFLAAMGGVIGLAVVMKSSTTENQWAAGLGLAGTAFAGAAGLAQSTKAESNSHQKDVKNPKAQGDATNERTQRIEVDY